MNENGPSITASKVAMMRAAHQLFDDPLVFDDPLALKSIDPKSAAKVRSEPRKYRGRVAKYIRAMVVARARFAEDELLKAVERGVRQYVILGAGLDTFGYRNPHSPTGLKVFEVDHPATQKWKRRQLERAGIPIPESLTFAPLDFESQSLAEHLPRAGFKSGEPAFYSWLGVTMYLNPEMVKSVLEFVSSSNPAGSGIVFDYVTPPSSQSFLRRLVFRLLSQKVGRFGEPWRSFFDPGSLLKALREMGFVRLKELGPGEINELYFSDREDNLRVGSFGHLIRAGL